MLLQGKSGIFLNYAWPKYLLIQNQGHWTFLTNNIASRSTQELAVDLGSSVPVFGVLRVFGGTSSVALYCIWCRASIWSPTGEMTKSELLAITLLLILGSTSISLSLANLVSCRSVHGMKKTQKGFFLTKRHLLPSTDKVLSLNLPPPSARSFLNKFSPPYDCHLFAKNGTICGVDSNSFAHGFFPR